MDLRALIQEYDQDHQNPVNQKIHLIVVPIIVFSILGMTNRVRLTDETSLGFVLWAAASLFYLISLPETWLKKFAFVFVLLVLLAMSQVVPLWMHVSLFVGGWVLQFIGHGKYEKRSPAFLRNLVQLLVGPYWVWVKLLRGRSVA